MRQARIKVPAELGAPDPKDYRFCGYAEAVAGLTAAQRGLADIVGVADWGELATLRRLRQQAFG